MALECCRILDLRMVFNLILCWQVFLLVLGHSILRTSPQKRQTY